MSRITGEAGFADPGFTDEHDVLSFGDEVEFSEGTELAAIDSGLLGVGETLEGPLFRQPSLLDAPVKGLFLAGMPLGAQQLNRLLKNPFWSFDRLRTNGRDVEIIEVFQHTFRTADSREIGKKGPAVLKGC